jgi:mannose-6-phosphate isomerase-like protein (cupin superfamily)
VATKKKKSEPKLFTGNRENTITGDRYLVEEVTIPAGGETHYIYHEKRHETWIPLEGEKVIAIFDGLPTDLRVGYMVMVPRKTKHKIVNSSDKDFRMLVVQSGADIETTPDIHEAPENTVPRKYKRGIEL